MTTDNPRAKKENIREMFDSIAGSYDFLNHFLSLGTDRFWRWRLLRMARGPKPRLILDIATGTGDLAIALNRCRPERIHGVDLSEAMLAVGKAKISKRGLEQRIFLEQGDAEALRFEDNHFDLVTAAFGVRNFENLGKGLAEMQRVLKPGGQVLLLEFSTVTHPLLKHFYQFYFRRVLPLLGRIISKHHFAYQYLPDSVGSFPYGEAFLTELQAAGFSNTRQTRLSGGIATIYSGLK